MMPGCTIAAVYECFVVRVFANIRLVNTMDIDKRMATAVPFVLG